jgi:PAS domain S-box-containing protein
MTPSSQDLDRIGFRYAPDATLVLAERIVLRANDLVAEVFGWSAREIEGQSIRVLYPGPADYALIGSRAHLAMQRDSFYRDERFMRRKDGRVVWMEGRGRTLDAALAGPAPLTPAEKRVAGYLVNGFTSKEIAAALACSPRTVEVHRANMIRKMNVRNSAELIHRLLSSS